MNAQKYESGKDLCYTINDFPKSTARAGALSIQPKSPEISVGSSNGTDHFGLVRPEFSGPALKVVHCDRSGHFGQSDRNVPIVPSSALFYPAYKTK